MRWKAFSQSMGKVLCVSQAPQGEFLDAVAGDDAVQNGFTGAATALHNAGDLCGAASDGVEGVSQAHGDALNLFGIIDKELAMVFEGEIDGDRVDGQAEDDQGRFSVTFRATRLADWP